MINTHEFQVALAKRIRANAKALAAEVVKNLKESGFLEDDEYSPEELLTDTWKELVRSGEPRCAQWSPRGGCYAQDGNLL
jgi:DNA-directed RNA polymerase specialized sigma54-like protein